MSDETQENENLEVSELDLLKQRADQLGIKYGAKVGVELLRTRVNAAINGDDDEPEEEDDSDTDEELDQEESQKETAAPKPTLTKKRAEAFGETAEERRQRLRKDALKLVRVRITCMNPLKKEFKGEVFTVSNSVIGTYRKFVPYNTESDEGWLIPKIMLNMLRERKFNNIRFETKNGLKIPRPNQVKEFAIEVLDLPTEKELCELERRQAMSRSVED